MDSLGPACSGSWTPGLGRSTTRDWNISGAHMAERCKLFLIIALGESILVIGATFVSSDFTRTTLAAFVVAFLGSVALWWVYFDLSFDAAERAFESSSDPGRLGRFAYTYLHHSDGGGDHRDGRRRRDWSSPTPWSMPVHRDRRDGAGRPGALPGRAPAVQAGRFLVSGPSLAWRQSLALAIIAMIGERLALVWRCPLWRCCYHGCLLADIRTVQPAPARPAGIESSYDRIPWLRFSRRRLLVMPFMFAAIAPHGFPLIPDLSEDADGALATRAAMDELGRRAADCGRRGAGHRRPTRRARRRRHLPRRYRAGSRDTGLARAAGRAECPGRRNSDRRYCGGGQGPRNPDRDGGVWRKPARPKCAAARLGRAHSALVSRASPEHARPWRRDRRSARGGHRATGCHCDPIARPAARDACRFRARGGNGGGV